MIKYTSCTLILLLAYSLLSQEPYVDFLPEPQIDFNPKSYICYRTDSPIVIDGRMNEKIWQKADWTDDFIDIEGDLRPKPNLKTNVKMLWDDDYFYFFCKMEEPHIWAKLKKRDSVIFYDNDFEIFIDPDGDTHNYYEFEMNAFNTVWDLFLAQPYRDSGCKVLDSWDIQGIKTAVHIIGTLNDPTDKDDGWSVEIAYPWKVLEECAYECPPQSGDQWRVNFSRVEWDTEITDGNYEKIKGNPEHNWVWSPQGLINMHYPEMWGFVQFSDKQAGSVKDQFIFNEKENIKWKLRRLYYKQRTYFMQNGEFADDLEALEWTDLIIDDYDPLQIYTTPTTFEAILKSKDGKTTISIFDNGLISVQKSEEVEK